VNAAIRLAQDQARQKHIQIEVKLDEQVVYLTADQLRLKQMLSNLLLNAIKFTPADGRVGIEVTGFVDVGSVNFTVWDTGQGVPQEFIPRMFKPFEQANPQGKVYTGSGLGLYLVQKMADMHGGGVQVESEPGKGSRFTISLPWKDRDQIGSFQQEKKGSGRLVMSMFDSHPLILVAEDNEIAISVLAESLKARGCQVVEARNGKEVIDQMEGQMVNLILMDIQMPEMDGIETIRFLRDKGYSQTPIIALTAAALPGGRERCLEAGANDYFSKPVDIARLVQAIKDLLG
jgi:CheY-like chemotaxis protein